MSFIDHKITKNLSNNLWLYQLFSVLKFDYMIFYGNCLFLHGHEIGSPVKSRACHFGELRKHRKIQQARNILIIVLIHGDKSQIKSKNRKFYV